jgi:hypothetical protein
MVSKTLFLTGGMPRPMVLDHLRKVQEDPSVNSIHIVEYDFGCSQHQNQQSRPQDTRNSGGVQIETTNNSSNEEEEEDEDEVALLLMDLLHFDSRRCWNTIKLTQCRGKMVHRIVETVTASNVRRFIFSPTRNTARASLVALSVGLAFQSSSLLTLSLNDVRIDYSLMDMLCSGLSKNTSIVDLSFVNCRFNQDDSAHMVLAGAIRQLRAPLQHLSFSNCRLEDQQCQDLVSSLLRSNNKALLELSLDGNKCHSQGLKALSSLLRESSLLVLDLSAQNLEGGTTMDLTQLTPGLASSRLRCLQLSSNTLNLASIQAVSETLQTNTSVLRVLHMEWCPMDEAAMSTLANGLRHNNHPTNSSSLSKLVLYGCGIDNQGLSRFSNRLRQMKGLQCLDLGGDQRFDSTGLFHLVASLQRNTELQELMLPSCTTSSSHGNSSTSTAHHHRHRHHVQGEDHHKTTLFREQAQQAIFLCDANRGGRRFLRAKDRAPVALWPLVLSQVQHLEMPNMIEGGLLSLSSTRATTTTALPISSHPDEPMSFDDDDSSSESDNDSMICDSATTNNNNNKPVDEVAMRRASVLYHLVRNVY